MMMMEAMMMLVSSSVSPKAKRIDADNDPKLCES